MWLQRILVALVGLPIGLLAIFAGETYFAIMMVVFLLIASYEYIGIIRIGGYHPADFSLYAAVLCLGFGRTYFPQIDPMLFLVFFVLVAGLSHLIQYERGRTHAATDLAFSYTGIVYIGVLGSHFMAIRGLPGGEWWLLVVLTAVWAADTGAYAIGKWFGKDRLAPRLSPKKTWQGYLGGVVLATVMAPLLLLLYHHVNFPVAETITYPRVTIIGVVMGIFTVAGDLIISMFKRTYNLKDTGGILPGHGGILDRLDSWLWAVSIGYYLLSVVFKI
ncbi:MAG: CDP-archaeol synthase [Anaerolineales bacterium]|nr:CDP-archaeol synthase [Anaerolineales bacterium]